MGKVKCKSYTLRDENGWLGQVVLTSDGMFASVTDWGNFAFAWRSYGEDFRDFIISINVDYFEGKMINGMAYFAMNRKIDAAAQRFAKKILPPLQKMLKEEIEAGINPFD